jgi:hypothetical protein
MSAYIQFGSGRLYVNPTAGNLATNPTPLQGLTIQDVTLDVSGDIKELKGSHQFPDDTAVADKKGTGKFGIGRKDLTMFNQIFFADAVVAGGVSVKPDELHTILTSAGTWAATHAYTLGQTILDGAGHIQTVTTAGTSGSSTPTFNDAGGTTTDGSVTWTDSGLAGSSAVTPPGSGTFLEDLGVSFSATGKALLKLPTGTPATGQYTVATGGVYTFAAADTGLGVLISYSYTLASTGAIYQVNNQILGYGPQVEIFMVDQYQPVSGVFNVIHIYAAKINKITIGNKRADYSMPEVDFAFFQAPSGRVLDMYSVNG